MNPPADRTVRSNPLARCLGALALAALMPTAMAQSSTGSAGSTTGAGTGTAAQPAQPVASGTPAGGNKAAKPPVEAKAAEGAAPAKKPAQAGTQSGAASEPATGATGSSR
ncbi:hypothetical protein [uncultured Azohydromonas sp.]|jgi:hypothetical protein|uniref:hypothetical protein n=1 Tax=uncultured Azohydromonas sp. TaxID=487342 RepID=UPI00262AA4FA|nr:hypothetical protein [uncultured Azohydromonas sp.]